MTMAAAAWMMISHKMKIQTLVLLTKYQLLKAAVIQKRYIMLKTITMRMMTS